MNLWVSKALLQKALSGVPGGNSLNYWAQWALGKHTQDNIALRIPGVAAFARDVDAYTPIAGSDILEIGTGWGAINALFLSLIGAKSVIATDYRPHVHLNTVLDTLEAMRRHAPLLASMRNGSAAGIVSEIDVLASCEDVGELFSRARITYLAPFDACATSLNDASVDLIYSYAVLAHFPSEDLRRFAVESKRILKPGGAVAHKIGLQDPYNRLNGGRNLNFLKFSDRAWELLFQSSIQYNNRLRASEHVAIYQDLDMEILCSDTTLRQKDLDALASLKVDARFVGMAPEDLAAISMKLIARRN